MNTQQSATETPALDAEAVEAYLREHPDFFKNRAELVSELNFDHECEGAVSLLEYQIRSLREGNRDIRRRLNELLSVARENDQISEQMHRLTVEMMNADSLDELLLALKHGLRNDFGADLVSIFLLHEDSDRHEDIRHPKDEGIAGLEHLIASLNPVCGRLTKQQLTLLFGDSADKVGSVAVVPLRRQVGMGLMAIGSHDPQRFHPNKGTIFLRQLGAIIANAAHPLLSDRPPAE